MSGRQVTTETVPCGHGNQAKPRTHGN